MISASIRPLELTLCPCDSVRALICGRWPRPLPPPSAGSGLGGCVGLEAWHSAGWLVDVGLQHLANFAAFFFDRSISYSWPPRPYVTVTQCRVAEVDQACGLGSVDHLAWRDRVRGGGWRRRRL